MSFRMKADKQTQYRLNRRMVGPYLIGGHKKKKKKKKEFCPHGSAPSWKKVASRNFAMTERGGADCCGVK